MLHTIIAPTMAILWRTLRDERIDPTPLFREMGVEQEVMKDHRARLLEKFMRIAIEMTGDECWGIKAVLHWHPSHLGALECTFKWPNGRGGKRKSFSQGIFW